MNKLKVLLFVVVIAAIAAFYINCGSSVLDGSFGSLNSPSSSGNPGNPGNCGPPNYSCSRTDLNIQAYDNPLPQVGVLVGANTLFTPHDFNNPVLRCTDNNTASSPEGWQVTPSGGDNDRIFSLNDSWLTLTYSNEGSHGVMSFDPINQKCVGLIPNFKFGSSSSWSTINDNVLYGLITTGTPPQIVKYTMNGISAAPTQTVISNIDGTTCPGLPTPFKTTWTGILNTDAGDAHLSFAASDLGGQQTGEYVIVYNQSNNHCTVWNTLTMKITSNDPAQPTGTINGSPGSYPFTIHDSVIYQGGWIQTAVGTTCTGCPSTHGPFLFQVGTLNVNLLTVEASGHDSVGYNYMYNLTNSPVIAKRTMDSVGINNPTQVNNLDGIRFGLNPNTNTPNGSAENHLGDQHANPSDTNPLVFGEMDQPTLFPLQSALTDEIYGVSLVDGHYMRFAHEYASGEGWNFYSQNAIGAMSQTGKFWAWTTDYFNTLGSITGGNTCIPGGWPWVAEANFTPYTNPAGVGPRYLLVPNKAPNNTGLFTYATTNGGTSGATEPQWPQTVGQTVNDNGIIWTNLGAANCRVDVFVVKLQ